MTTATYKTSRNGPGSHGRFDVPTGTLDFGYGADSLPDMRLRLMSQRIIPPAEPLESREPGQPALNRRFYMYMRTFIQQATIRSVLAALVKLLVRRPVLWLLDHIYWFVVTVTSPSVGPAQLLIRRRMCDECSQKKLVGRYHYCDACGGCPRWVFARLEFCLPKAGFNCSLGLHPGSIAIRKRKTNGEPVRR